MADFLPAMQRIFVCETGHVDGGDGAYHNDWPTDPGGPTKWGVALLTFYRPCIDANATEETIKGLTRDDALRLYREHFWNAIPLAEVHDQILATKMLEMRVNLVAGAETKILQRALRDCDEIVAVDGDFGPLTLAAANRRAGEQLLGKVIARLIDHYHDLVRRYPKLEGNLNGWLARAAWPRGHARGAA